MVNTLFCRTLVLVSFCAFPLCASADASAAPRWNILFVFADDWGRYASCYKGLDGRPGLNDVISTPNFDRVAHDGVLFRNAFVNAPSCTPSRSSLLSGRYFFNTGLGAILRGAIWDESIPSFPLLLRDAGYHIGKSYKVWSPGNPVDAPFGRQRYAYERSGNAPNNFSEESYARMEKGLSVEAARAEILAQVRGNFDAFLADRKPGQPWLYFFGTTTTHRKWIRGSGKKLWGIDPDRLKGRMPAFLPDVPEVREDVADYLGESQAVDAELGILLERLQASGDADRTLIVVSGDHGMPGVPFGKCNLYDHGTAVALLVRVPGVRGARIVDDFVSLPDLAPTFMEIAGVKIPGGLYGRSLLSLLKSGREGQIEPDRTWVISGRERHVDVAREGNLPYPMRALRTKDFVYIRNFAPDRMPMGDPLKALTPEAYRSGALVEDTRIGFADMDGGPTKAWMIAHRNDPQWRWLYEHAFGKRPSEELYDLRKDPDQVKNVAGDPNYAEMKAELAAQLIGRLKDAGDPRVVGDGKAFDRSPFTDPSGEGPDGRPLKGSSGGRKKAE
ncbi:MAG: sulfatase-like hydrolase/transferase [Opitutaceae bacterium]|nr:sulfatase-like hydrolase/transferase [Opitutaceae bacterium]